MIGGVLAQPDTASATGDTGCTEITTQAHLNKIRLNPAGAFCLGNDIDLTRAGFAVPLPEFTGSLDGRGFSIRNLKSKSLFDSVAVSGKISNLHVLNAKFLRIGGSAVGILTGRNAGTIENVHVSGHIESKAAAVGGIAGINSGKILRSSSAAFILIDAPLFSSAGGIAGSNSGHINRSYATGHVRGASPFSFVGGLVGRMTSGIIGRSYAIGTVTALWNDSSLGGLVGVFDDGWIIESYATGQVDNRGANGQVGGLVGVSSGTIQSSYAAGLLKNPLGQTGGLVGADVWGSHSSSFYDEITTGATFNAGGGGLTTKEMKKRRYSGFRPKVWGLTYRVTYPYLKVAPLDFEAALATIVWKDRIYTFIPIDQFEALNYIDQPQFAGFASAAAVYTMIAHAIGVTRDLPFLIQVKIDKNFWNDATQTATFTGPVTKHASLGPDTQIEGDNLIDALTVGTPAVVRGPQSPSSPSLEHHMLMTSFTKENGVITAMLANDPSTGKQIKIDPVTGRVIDPETPLLTAWRMTHFRKLVLK